MVWSAAAGCKQTEEEEVGDADAESRDDADWAEGRLRDAEDRRNDSAADIDFTGRRVKPALR